MMKKSFIFTLIGIGAILASISVDAATLDSKGAVDDWQEPVETPVDLFLGMDYDEDYSYTGSDSLLYRFPGLIKQELDATWYTNIDDDFFCKYRCSLGLYIDKDYPSEAVFRRVEESIDSMMAYGFNSFDGLGVNPACRLREANVPKNSQQILDYGRQVFDLFTGQMKADRPESAYETIPEARMCFVAHKVYDKGNQATYLIEMSYDYNGSNGCPSMAYYLTIDKNTGRILQPEDVIRQYGAQTLKRLLWNEYVTAYEKKGFGDEEPQNSPDDLLTAADGCALVNEGVMFYYLPYHIGCGAEGEYNLIIDVK